MLYLKECHQLAEGSFTKAKFEKLGGLFDLLKDKGIVRILMVGSMSRPSLNIRRIRPFHEIYWSDPRWYDV